MKEDFTKLAKYDKNLHRRYCAMVSRCSDEKSPSYSNYGGRGITVCDEWKTYEAFKHDMLDGFVKHCEEHGTRNTSIDRADNNGGYSKENCRWVTNKVNQNNRRNSKPITAFGKTQPVEAWQRETGIDRRTIEWRMKQIGLPPEKALRTKNNLNRQFTDEQVGDIRTRFSKGATVYSLAKEYGVWYRAMQRICRGESYKNNELHR